MHDLKLHLQDKDWLYTSEGLSRGFIQPEKLNELWFHTGTNCNLSCPFCFEKSMPGDKRIDSLGYDIAKSYIDQALELGVSKFCFTGGEPFANKDIIKILDYALRYRPCFVLTNGTDPLINKMDEVLSLKNNPNELSFRISLDSVVETEHDKNRGIGNFKKAVNTILFLDIKGFSISIAGITQSGSNYAEKRKKQFKIFFEKIGISNDIPITIFPDLNQNSDTEITEFCMKKYYTAEKQNAFMCSNIKMLAVKDNIQHVYPCTLVDDDPDYNLGNDLFQSMKYRIILKHKRCMACFANGVSCSG